MKASIIIPTYNGAMKITSLLNALAGQTYRDFELLVVIDGSTDNTYEIISESMNQFQDAKILQQTNKGRAASRNAGVKESKGEVLIFLDDDVEPLNNLVELHIRHHQTMHDTILVGQLFMDIRSNKNDFFNYRYFIEQKWDSLSQNEFGSVTFENYRFTSGNLSLKRELFYTLNGFDERLIDSEDFDFCMRALMKQIQIYFNKKIFAWHKDFSSLKGYINRVKAYKHAKNYLLKLHPEYLKLHPGSFEINRQKVNFSKQTISRFFIYNSFWNVLLTSNPFLVLVPRKIRFKLYEIIIYSSTLHDKKI